MINIMVQSRGIVERVVLGVCMYEAPMVSVVVSKGTRVYGVGDHPLLGSSNDQGLCCDGDQGNAKDKSLLSEWISYGRMIRSFNIARGDYSCNRPQ